MLCIDLDAHRLQRMILRMTGTAGCRDKTFKHDLLLFDGIGVDMLYQIFIKGRKLRIFFIGFVIIDKMIKGFPAGLAAVKRACIDIKLMSDIRNCLSLLSKGSSAPALCDLGRLTKLFQHCFLFRLIRMKLQTEFADAYFIKPLLYYLKGCHLFSYEKNGLSLSKSVCDQSCDRLGLTCSGRSVKNKAFALACGFYGKKL